MKSRNLLVPVASTLVAFTLFASAPAEAHTPDVTEACDGLTVTATNYFGSGSNNRVTVTIDGIVVDDELFGGSFEALYAWSQTEAHAWSVVIDANLVSGDPTQYDRTFTGEQQACQQPTTTSTSTTQPTTTSSSNPIPSSSVVTLAPTTTAPASTSTSSTPTTSPASSVPSSTSLPPKPTQPDEPFTSVTSNPPTTPSSQPPSPTPTPELPATGSGDWLWPFTIIAGCVVGIGGILVRRRDA